MPACLHTFPTSQGRDYAPGKPQMYPDEHSARSATTPSPPCNGGEGRGEEARFGFAPLLGPLPTPSSRGEEEKACLQIFVEHARTCMIAVHDCSTDFSGKVFHPPGDLRPFRNS